MCKSDTKKDNYERVRAQIVHEDDVVHHRVTWLLLIEAFLLAGFAGIHGNLLSKGICSPIVVIGVEAAMFLLVLLATQACRIIARSIGFAEQHHQHLREWWWTQYPDERRAVREFDEGCFWRPWSWNHWWVDGTPFCFRQRLVGEQGIDIVNLPPEAVQPTEYPPIMGYFLVKRGFRRPFAALAQAFVYVNVLLALACIAIIVTLGLTGCWTWGVATATGAASTMRISIVRSSRGDQTSIQFDGDSSEIPQLNRQLNAIR